MGVKVPLRGARLKLERAIHHIRDFEAKSGSFFKRNYRLVLEFDAKTSQRQIRAKNQAPIPDEFALIAGDAIHNLRAALDIMAYYLVASSGRSFNERTPHFPIVNGSDPVRLESAIRSACIHFACEEVVGLLKAFQPYPGGHLELFELDALDVVDKHRLVFGTADFAELRYLRLRDIDPSAPNHTIANVGFGNVSVIASWPARGPQTPQWRRLNKERDLGYSPTIIFNEGPFSRKPILPVLRRLANNVERVIEATETLFTPI